MTQWPWYYREMIHMQWLWPPALPSTHSMQVLKNDGTRTQPLPKSVLVFWRNIGTKVLTVWCAGYIEHSDYGGINDGGSGRMLQDCHRSVTISYHGNYLLDSRDWSTGSVNFWFSSHHSNSIYMMSRKCNLPRRMCNQQRSTWNGIHWLEEAHLVDSNGMS